MTDLLERMEKNLHLITYRTSGAGYVNLKYKEGKVTFEFIFASGDHMTTLYIKAFNVDHKIGDFNQEVTHRIKDLYFKIITGGDNDCRR